MSADSLSYTASSSSSDSSDSLIPVGFNVDRVRKLHQTATLNTSVMTKTEVSTIDKNTTPKELRYETLLDNAMDALHKSSTEMGFKLKIPLDVKREPNHKTSINLINLSRVIDRSSEHIRLFILRELHTTGSVNKEGRLIVKGSFNKNKIQTVVSRFLDEFVKCLSCNKYDTSIVKEERLWFVVCNKCASKKSVEIDGSLYKRVY
ncbi:Eukaryotic translation initiation factor 2 subunit beta [Cucumispora dikerogammari]|nr:Eukaryotic translation initiation factor 2 subunit beta [Cucumispora dikerogammari]